MKKKIAVLFLAAAQMFLLSGCWNYVEINQQINVSGMAIDIGHGGKRLHLSVEIVTVGASERGQFESHVLESEGNTVFEAIRALMSVSSKKLYFGHCKLIVLGEDLARSGIREYLDLPIRNHELRTSMDVVIAKGGRGEDILRSKALGTTIVSYHIVSTLMSCEKANGCAGMTKEYQVYDGLETEGLAITIPAIELQMVDDAKVTALCGAGAFEGDRLIGWLTLKEAAQLSLLKGKYKTGIITIESAESPWFNTSFEVYKAKTNTKIFSDKNGIVTAQVHVKLWVNVGEVQTKVNFIDPKQTERNTYALEKNLEHDLNHMVDAAQRTYRCDIIGIGEKLEKDDPAAWEKLGPDWKEHFPQVKFEIKAEVVIMSGGVSGSSAG